jgi:cytochrome b561
VILRVIYRLTWPDPMEQNGQYRQPLLHWILYGVVMAMPLLGWAGASDYDSLAILFGITLPPIWPKHAGYGQALLDLHAYVAFGMLALVALHIAIAMQDHLTRARDADDAEI